MNQLTTKVTAESVPLDFFSSLQEKTRLAYCRGWNEFKVLGLGLLESEDIANAVALFLRLDHGEATAIVYRYRTMLLDLGRSPSTVNLRLSAIRSCVDFARQCGVITWSLPIRNVRNKKYRDTRGPGEDGFWKVVDALERERRTPGRRGKIATRDLAIVRLLHDLGLRCGEVVALDLDDVDLRDSTVRIVGKGELESTLLTMPAPTRCAVQQWLQLREEVFDAQQERVARTDHSIGSSAGSHNTVTVAGRDDTEESAFSSGSPGIQQVGLRSLFLSFDPVGKGDGRLSGRSIGRLCERIGKLADVRRVRPHGLRHTAITTALQVTDGNIRAVQQFSRHVDPRTIMRYDDNRKDVAGQVAKMVAER